MTTPEVLTLLAEGENNIEYSAYKDAILIFSHLNDDKINFTKYIAGNHGNVNKKNCDYVPQLILDENHKTFYDFPQFIGVSEIESQNIAASYFVKEIIDSVESVKFVFTVSFSSIQDNAFTKKLDSLVSHAAKMIRNIEKLKNSIALIVTNINSENISNEEIMKMTIRSLKDVKVDLKVSIAAEKFINALIDTDVHNNTRIGILRNTETARQSNKQSVDEIIYKNIQFTTHDTSDFDYNIYPQSYVSDFDFNNKNMDSEIDASNFIVIINKHIVSVVKNIGEDIRNYYFIKEQKSHDIQELREIFASGYDSLQKIVTDGNSELEKLVREISRIIKDLKITSANINLSNITRATEFLRFLKNIDQSTALQSPQWNQELSDLVKYLNDSQKWYSFLIKLFTILSEYKVQQDTNQYKDLTDDLIGQISQVTRYNRTNSSIVSIIHSLNILLQKLGSASEERKIIGVQFNKWKLKFLNDVLDTTVNYNIDSACTKNKLVLAGQYIKLSDVNNRNCTQAKFIEIFALNKVFIDTDFDKTGKEVHLFIMAPAWEIRGSPKIILDGRPGRAHDTTKARNGIGPGSSGEDGQPGKPGGPAGNFVGIGQNFTNVEHLSISVRGGKGGPGQHGGDGVKGEDGVTPALHYIDGINKRVSLVQRASADFTVNCNGKDLSPKGGKLTLPNDEDIFVWCYFYGKDCTGGGKGGDGGIGGEGGNARKVVLINLNKDSNITVHNSKGDPGMKGDEGKGGQSGKTGQILEVKNGPSYYAVFNKINSKNSTVCASGKQGRPGNNTANIEHAKVSDVVHIPAIINNYKNYVRQHLNDSIKGSSLRAFLKHIDNHESVQNVYDTFGFIDEFRGFEDQFFNLREQLPFLTIYESLLARINQHAKKLSDKKQMTEDEKKLLSYLYAAILSKMNSINNNVANNLVIDLPGYLDFAINDINELKDVSNVAAIDEYQKKYREVIEEKIQEANDFIEKEITPEIGKIFQDVDYRIEQWVEATKKQEAVAEGEIDKLRDQKLKMQKALSLKAMLGVVQIASQMLMLAGPLGAAAGTFIGTGIGIAEGFVSADGGDVIGQLTKLPAGVKTSLSTVKDKLKKKQDAFGKLIDKTKEELKKLTEQPSDDESILKELKDKVDTIHSKLNLERNREALNEDSADNVQSLQTELASSLTQEKDKLLKKTTKGNTKIKKTVETIEFIQNGLSILQSSADLYTKLKDDQTKIDKVAAAIDETSNKLNELKQYENKIYKIMIPECRKIENSMRIMEKQLENKSHVALDVSEWNMKRALKDIKLELQRMTKGFEVQEDLNNCIDKIDHGMSVMIEVYDRIQEYRDKQELAAYIANINSYKARQIITNDTQLNIAIVQLDVAIKSNLVFEKHEVAMRAFKQHIFPFANYYMDDFKLPHYLQSNDTNNLLSHATRNIEHLKSKVTKSRTTIYKYDQYVEKHVRFSSASHRTSPFVVWKYAKNGLAISRLLNGEEITIKSDITEGPTQNAIKFNVVGIRFKLSNEALQRKLDEKLQNFDVKMTHLGDSHYRCDDKFYTINSDKLSFTYSFAKNNNGYPLIENAVYDKTEHSEPVLSPYAMWRIQLTNDDNDFDLLNEFENREMDLELEGVGQYAERGIDVCNDHLIDHYELDDATTEMYNIHISNHKSPRAMSNHQQEENHRVRRSIDGHDTVQPDEKGLFATSGAPSSMKNSFINNIFNLIGTGIVMFKYVNPVNKITNWFMHDETNIDQELLNVLDTNAPISEKLSNMKSLPAELLEIANISQDKESPTISNILDSSLVCSHGNLLLLDLIIRGKTRVKHQQKGNLVDSDTNFEYAQTLAFREYVPSNV